MAHQLPPLPYDFGALEPHIDAKTMEIHHDKHHAAYVNNLNAALEKAPELQSLTPEELVKSLSQVPEAVRTAVRNNGGGHVNHSMFWKIMGANQGGEPSGRVAEAITKSFGNFQTLKEKFNAAGVGRFGSGWVWVVLNKSGQLDIVSTPNQDNPLMDGLYPLMGNDVWEHAYYLKYQNKRADYVKAFWNVINWKDVANRFAKAVKG